MAIRAKVKPSGPRPGTDAAVEAVIARGGAPAAAAKPEPPADGLRKFTLRLPDDLARAIEADAAGRPGKISVNTWLLEAATEHLKRRRGSTEG